MEKINRLLEEILGNNNVRIELDDSNTKIRVIGDVESLSDQDKINIKNHKEEIIACLKKIKEAKYFLSNHISVIPESLHYPLSFSQLRLWILSQFEDGSKVYNMPFYVELSYYDIEVFKDAIYSVIDRHESLRTVFKKDENGDVRQWILSKEELGFIVEYEDLRMYDNKEELAKSYINADSYRPFDLEKGPLLRAKILHLDENKYLFYYNIHHIISDGWSMEVLTNDIFAFYEAYKKNESPELPVLRIQYKDYATWQIRQIEEETFKLHKTYWLNKFEGELPILELPGNKRRPTIKTHNGNTLVAHISAETTQKLKSFCNKHEGSLFIGLLSVLNILFYRYTSQNDIIIGTAIAGRDQEELENQIGFYINTLALRNQLDPAESFISFYNRVKESTLSSFEHQSFPFDKLIEDLNVKRDVTRSVLFDVMMSVQNIRKSKIQRAYTSEIHDLGNTLSKFDLTINFQEENDHLICDVTYNRDVFDQEFIKQLIHHFKQLLIAALNSPDLTISSLEFISEEEKNKIMYDFNNTQTSYPKDKTTVELFEEQVTKNPQAIAVVFENTKLTYEELNIQANRLAHYLKDTYAIVPDDLVAIVLERSEQMIVAMLAVLKSSGAYLPIDFENPKSRIDYIVKDSHCKVVIDEEMLSGFDQSNKLNCFNLLLKPRPDHLAYVIYTSGSTGNPKGVLINHSSIVDYSFGLISKTNIGTCQTFGLVSTIAADLGNTVIYPSLITGGTLHLFSKTDVMDLTKIVDSNLDCIKITPSHWKAMVVNDQILIPNKCLIFGGEQLSKDIIDLLRDKNCKCKVYNHYGPTETTIGKLIKEIDVYNTNYKPLLGKPFSETQIYILGSNDQIQPIGVVGQICIGGAGLARGYLRQPELTAEKFIANAFNQGKRLYKTGDLGRWTPDGNVEFLGRIDDQVKIRGFRIELGEIESALRSIEGVLEATVLPQKSDNGDLNLVAYWAGKSELNLSDLKSALRKYLPSYMIPLYFMQLDKLPLTPNGKIDKSSLPQNFGLDINADVSYVAPRNSIDEKLIKIWEEVLGNVGIGINDNFFEIGGHSLKAIHVVSRIQKNLNKKVNLREVFSYPKIKELSDYLMSVDNNVRYITINRVSDLPYYPVSFSQKRMYIVNQLLGSNLGYNIFYAVKIIGQLDVTKLQVAFLSMIERHEILRTIFKVESGRIVQAIFESIDFRLEIVEVSLEMDIDDEIKQFRKGFYLEHGPLLRAGLVKVNDGYILLFDIHHIISDGTSREILIDELLKFYHDESLPPLPIQYKDYASWQQLQYEKGFFLESEKYWLKELESPLPVLNLPLDFKRPARQSYEGALVHLNIEDDLFSKLKKLCLQTGTTLYMVLLSAYKVLLQKYTGQEDILVGCPISGRSHPEVEGLIGMFINTVVIRSKPRENKKFSDYLLEIKGSILKSINHQDFPFEELIEKLDLKKDLSRNALFDVMFEYQEMIMINEKELGELKIKPYSTLHNISKFDMTMKATEQKGSIQLSVEFNTNLFEAHRIKCMMLHYVEILKQIVDKPEKELSSIHILTQQEELLLTKIFNNEKGGYSKGVIHELISEQGKRQGKRVAVKDENYAISYEELDRRSNQLGRYLRNRGIGRDSIVGLLFERSADLIVGVLGVLKAGGAFLPLDPENPTERVEYICEDSMVSLVITHNKVENFDNSKIEILDIYDKEVRCESFESLDNINEGSDLAYVIYTSGTTGKPKGVMIEHRNLISYSFWAKKILNLTSISSSILTSSFAFDLGYTSIFPNLLSGGCLHIVSKELYTSPERLLSYISNYKITYLKITPSLLSVLIQCDYFTREYCKDLETIVLGGEKIKVGDLELALSKCKYLHFIDEYGPAETTVGVIATLINDGNFSQYITKPTIGNPIDNSRIYILDKKGKLVPIGVWGEICIGGAGVGRGYLNKISITKEKFVNDPFINGGIIYKSGDIGRWLENGTIEYLGRDDNQVKILGFRVELDEIEICLKRFEGIKDVVVISKNSNSGEPILVAYYTTFGFPLDITLLLSHAKQSLPYYMVPFFYCQLDVIPLNDNGKIDRDKLQEMPLKEKGVDSFSQLDNIEREIISVMAEVLKIEEGRIGPSSNFFQLGGNSLNAIMLISKLHKRFGFDVDISIDIVMEKPTIAELLVGIVGLVGNTSTKISLTRTENKEFYNLSHSQLRLWTICHDKEVRKAYNAIDAFEVDQQISDGQILDSFLELANRHESLRTVFKLVEDIPRQFVLDKLDVNKLVEWIECERDDLSETINKCVEKQRNTIFNFEEGPLFKLSIIKVNDLRRIIFLNMHHIISDAWSMNILRDELIQLLKNPTLFKEDNKSEGRIQYKDFVAWHEKFLVENKETIFVGLNEELMMSRKFNFPIDVRDTLQLSNKGSAIYLRIEDDKLSDLRRICSGKNASLYTLLMAAYALTIFEYSKAEKLVIGVPLYGRSLPESRQLVGLFVNALPLVIDYKNSELLDSILMKISNKLSYIMKYQDYPLDLLMKDLDHDVRKSGLFDVAFNWLPFGGANSFEVLRPFSFANERKFSKHVVLLNGSEDQFGINLIFEYNSTLLVKATMEKFVHCFENIIDLIVKNPNMPIAEYLNKNVMGIDKGEKKLFDINF